jgi:hypothetical protein
MDDDLNGMTRVPEPMSPDIAVPPWPKFLRGCLGYRESLDRELPSASRLNAEHDEP